MRVWENGHIEFNHIVLVGAASVKNFQYPVLLENEGSLKQTYTGATKQLHI